MRFWAAALVAGISLTLALGHRHAPPSRLGQSLFATLSVIAFAYCLLAGIRYTAGALSEERREGTLGLLFLTDLRGFDVVIGKLAVTSLHAFFGYRGSLILMLDCLALTWVGMWSGLQGQSFARAVLNTMARVMIPPWIVLFIFFGTARGSSLSALTVRDFLTFWFVLVFVSRPSGWPHDSGGA